MSSVIGERRQYYDDFDGQINIRDNTGTAEIKGVEWQLQYRPTKKLLVHANYSFVDLEQIRVHWSAPALEIRDVSGANPRHLGSILVNYVTDNSLSLSAMLTYQSTIYHRVDEDNASYARLD